MRPDARPTVRLMLSGAALLWALALPLAVYAADRSDASPSASSLFAFLVYQMGSIVCHQRAERSFHLASLPMPVCARCVGIYAGAAVASVVATMWLRRAEAIRLTSIGLEPDPTNVTTPIRLTPEPARVTSRPGAILAMAAMPALGSLFYEWTSGDMPSNEVRAMTGLILGTAVAWIVLRLE